MTPSVSRCVIPIGLVVGLISLPTVAAEGPSTPRQPEGEFLHDLLGALTSDTVGPGDLAARSATRTPSPQTVTPPGSYALSIDGDFELGGYVFKEGKPFLHNDGGDAFYNTALGLDALINTTLGQPMFFSGSANTALGHSALADNTEGYNNTAAGAEALESNTTGFGNTAAGADALRNNITGLRNTAVGHGALALNVSGSRNIGLGRLGGSSNYTGSDNIWIANYGQAESNTLRIGTGTGTGDFQLNRAFISGIQDAMLTGGGEQSLCVDDSDQVGPCSPSSIRFKQNVHTMGEVSARLRELRPVVFEYKREVKREAPEQSGLIAEEVAEIYPQLVSADADGKPFAVRYDLLTPLLLNELQRQEKEIDALHQQLAAVTRRLDELARKPGAGDM